MLHEFAIDPATICSRDSIRHIFDSFCLGKGRLISRYPKKWFEMINVPEGRDSAYLAERWIEAKRDGTVYKGGRVFDRKKTWVNNAIESDRGKPFKAIISTVSGPNVFCRDDIDEKSEPLRDVKNSYDASRSEDEMADYLAGLLRFSSEIIFIDPYCQFDSRHCRPLIKFLSYAVQEKMPSRIEYHAECKGASQSHIEQRLRTLNLSLPCPFYFIRWKAKPGAPPNARLHDRGVVTNLAAVSSDGGLDVGVGNTPLKLLEEDSFQRLKNQYSSSSDAFYFIDGWCIQNGKVLTVTIENGQWAVKN